MSRVYWDSMMFIYMLEGNPTFTPAVDGILNDIDRRGDTLCTSIFCVGEVLTGPRKFNSMAGIAKVKQYFAGDSIEVLPFTIETADRFSLIRATTAAKPADAIHLATASAAGADVFFTNDSKLLKLRLQIPGIQFITGLDARIYGLGAP
jgi:predicted nucleic acid-binding protein